MGLISYWPFDESSGTVVVDVFGNFNGTLEGISLPKIIHPGIIGSAALLNTGKGLPLLKFFLFK